MSEVKDALQGILVETEVLKLEAQNKLSELNASRSALEEEKSLRDENTELMNVGPVIEVKFEQLEEEEVVVSMMLPEKITNKIMVQFASAVPGEVYVLYKEKRKKVTVAHFEMETTIAHLLDKQKNKEQIVDFGKVRFNIANFVSFCNMNLRW